MDINKPRIAIAFDTIVDEDFGLIKLIHNQYLDTSVFDIEKFKKSVPEILEILYTREELNPLLSFVLPNIDKFYVDEIYHEFLDTKYSEILENSIGTNVQTYITMMLNSKEFDVVIFCYNQDQLDFINNITEFNNTTKVLFSDDIHENTSQYYFKYLYQSYSLKDKEVAHFYYSTIGPNLNDSKDDIKINDEEMKLIRKNNYISLYSLYDFSKLKSKNDLEEGAP